MNVLNSKNVYFACLLSSLSKNDYDMVGTLIAYKWLFIHQKIKLLSQLSKKLLSIFENSCKFTLWAMLSQLLRIFISSFNMILRQRFEVYLKPSFIILPWEEAEKYVFFPTSTFWLDSLYEKFLHLHGKCFLKWSFQCS